MTEKKLYLVFLVRIKNKIENFKSLCEKYNLPLRELLVLKKSFARAGGEIRIVGGNVRDLILKRTINSSTDLASDLNPDQIIDCLKKSNIRYLKTGYKFGTLTILFNDLLIEVTSLRKDLSSDGRWAKVKYTNNWLEDANRRDLTINSIYSDLDGNIFDYFGGKEDLINGKVVFIGKPLDRIKEDYLRILRFLRFSLEYSKTFDDECLAACNSMKKKISFLSFERRISEFKKIIITKGFSANFHQLNCTKILDYVFNLRINSTNINKFFKIEKKIGDLDSDRRIKFLFRNKVRYLKKSGFYKLGKESFSRIAKRLKFKNFSENEVFRNILLHGKILVSDEIIFNFVDGNISLTKFQNFYKIVNSWKNRRSPISGDDIKQLGIKEGKLIGKYLGVVLDWWIMKKFRPNKSECMEYLQKLTKKQTEVET